jgi:hypothetical protein
MFKIIKARFTITLSGIIYDEDDFTDEEKCNTLKKLLNW